MSDIEDAISRLNRLNRALSTVHQDIASTLHQDLRDMISAIDQLSVVLVGSVVVALDDLISVQLSTIHPDLMDLAKKIGTESIPSTLVANVREEISVLSTLIHPDLISLVGRIGSVAEPDTLNYVLLSTKEVISGPLHTDLISVATQIENLQNLIGEPSTTSTLTYVTQDLTNRIGEPSTASTLTYVTQDLTNRIGEPSTASTLAYITQDLANKIGTEADPSTLVANVREEISVLSTLVHDDLTSVTNRLETLRDQIGSVTDADTLNYLMLSTREALTSAVEKIGSTGDTSTLLGVLCTLDGTMNAVDGTVSGLISQIGGEDQSSTLIYNVKDLTERIGEPSTTSTLTYLTQDLVNKIGTEADPSTLVANIREEISVLSTVVHDDLTSVTNRLETLRDQIGSVTEADTLNYLTLSTKESLSTVVDKIGSTGDPSTLLGVLCTLDGTMNTVDNTLSAYIDPKLSTLNVRLGEEHTGLHFDGQDDYVSVNHTSELSISTGTVEVWVKNLDPTQTKNIVSKGLIGLASTRSYEIDYTNPNYRWRISLDGSTVNQLVVSADDTLLHHIVGTYDGETSRMYLDGEPVASVTVSGTIYATDKDLKIAAGHHAPYNYFRGEIYEVRIYNEALTSTEVRSNYRNTNNPVKTGNLVVWYKLDELEGTSAIDSANGINGVIIGADWIPSKGTLGHSLQLVSKDIQSTLHPDLTSVATQIETLQDLIGSEADSSTLVANVREEISVLSTLIHDDLTSLVGRIGSVTESSTLNYLINELNVNRIGDVNTEDTLNWLLDKIRGVERWRVKKLIDLYAVWGIVTTCESFMCFIGDTDRVVFNNADGIGQLVIPYSLISKTWGVPTGYTDLAKGFAWDGSKLWVLIKDTSDNWKICRVVDYTANPWSFDKEYIAPTNTCKGLIYRNGKLITYDYGDGSPPFTFYEIDPETGSSSSLWSTSDIAADPGDMTYDSANDWILIIQPRGYGGLYGLDPATGNKVVDFTEIGTLSGSQLYGVAYSPKDGTIWTDNGTKWRQIITISSLYTQLAGVDADKIVRDILVNSDGKLYICDLSTITSIENINYLCAVESINYLSAVQSINNISTLGGLSTVTSIANINHLSVVTEVQKVNELSTINQISTLIGGSPITVSTDTLNSVLVISMLGRDKLFFWGSTNAATSVVFDASDDGTNWTTSCDDWTPDGASTYGFDLKIFANYVRAKCPISIAMRMFGL